ncbi:MAG: PD-(D/E)XK nuclease family protein [Bacteroidales bacterium]|nr:PD-(D/E)XK nuclease family protein [Bacteroidales bacterium]
MKPFLKQVADHYYSLGDISDRCFIFPNRRSMVFFRKYLSETVASDIDASPFLAPEMLTINDFFALASGLKAADRITLLLELYDCYASLNPKAETLDEFIFWGDVILGDFDDVDKYLADPKQIFTNIADFKRMQDTFEYLSDRQRKALESFAGHFADTSSIKENFLQIWNIMLPLYESFTSRLEDKGIAYEGMLYRRLASESDAIMNVMSERAYVFVGLNALNECEKKVLKQMKDMCLAEFCWDWSGRMMKDPQNKASFFMTGNLAEFPQAFALEEDEAAVPDFNVLSVPSSYGQVKHLESILDRVGDASGSETAVVLPDEGLLLPLLNSVPESVSDVNVTMGYPLSASAVFVLMSDIAAMQMHMRVKDGAFHFYHKHVWDVLASGLLDCRQISDEVRKSGKFYIPQEDLNGHPLLDIIFKPVLTDLASNSPDQIEAYASYLQEIVSALAARMAENGDDVLELDAAKAYYTSVNSLRSRRLGILPSTFARLLDALFSGASVPFKGEPLKGMQIMGPLETRALDFRNLVVLSCNEGMFPRRSVSSSFVPPELRKAFGLPTYEYQDAVWAYYFYRMVSRAENVWLVYDSRTEGLKRGEESRYIKQLKYHFGINLKRYVSHSDLVALDKDDDKVEKTEDMMRTIGSMTFSASAIQNYVICPMKFCYYSVLKVVKDDDVAESLDSAMIGNVYHNVMRALYFGEDAMMSDVPFEKMDSQPDKGMDEISSAYLEKWISEDRHGLISAKVESLMKSELNVDEVRGRDLVVRSVIVRYVIETLRRDLELLHKTGADSFRIIGLEKKVAADICGCRFFGVMDRIDSIVPGSVRLVDYKSGSDSQDILAVDDDTAETVVSRIFDGDYQYKRSYKAALQFHIYDRMLKEAGIAEDGQLLNSLYSTSEMFKSAPALFPVNDRFSKMMDERLERTLGELKDKNVPFERTNDADACTYCDFKMICGR